MCSCFCIINVFLIVRKKSLINRNHLQETHEQQHLLTSCQWIAHSHVHFVVFTKIFKLPWHFLIQCNPCFLCHSCVYLLQNDNVNLSATVSPPDDASWDLSEERKWLSFTQALHEVETPGISLSHLSQLLGT